MFFSWDRIGGFVDSWPKTLVPSASNRSTPEWTLVDSGGPLRRLLRLDPGDPDVVGPFGALVAVLLGALRQVERARSEGKLLDQAFADRGRGGRLVDQRVQPLLD